MVGRIEVGEAVIVPEETVALVGQDERQGDLGVHLREPAGDAPHVQEAVLELARAEKELVFRGKEPLGNFEGGLTLDLRRCQAPPAGGLLQQQVPGGIEEGQRTVGPVAYGHGCGAYLHGPILPRGGELGGGDAFRINQFRERLEAFRLQAYPDRVVRQGLQDEGSVSGGNPDVLTGTSGQKDDGERHPGNESFHSVLYLFPGTGLIYTSRCGNGISMPFS